MRRAALLAVAIACCAAPQASARGSNVSVLTIRGRGFGHGIGLSQWGAERRAESGQSARRILSFYYPGTTLLRAPATTIRVLIESRASIKVGSPAGVKISSSNGRRLLLARGRHTLTATTFDGKTVRLPARIEPTTGPVRLGGTSYEGRIELSADGPSRIRVVNVLPLENYVAGVVSSECPGYWRLEALEAQAIASRSYAIANLHPGAPYDVFADDRSQNYHGLFKHLPKALEAAAATRGLALSYRGAVVPALFSASNGGRTSVADGVWSDSTAPYFVARPDRFDLHSPGSDWGPVRLTLDQVRTAFPNVPASVSSVEVTRNAGDRVTSLVFTAPDGSSTTLSGYRFQQRFGLRSNYFSISGT